MCVCIYCKCKYSKKDMQIETNDCDKSQTNFQITNSCNLKVLTTQTQIKPIQFDGRTSSIADDSENQLVVRTLYFQCECCDVLFIIKIVLTMFFSCLVQLLSAWLCRMVYGVRFCENNLFFWSKIYNFVFVLTKSHLSELILLNFAVLETVFLWKHSITVWLMNIL